MRFLFLLFAVFLCANVAQAAPPFPRTVTDMRGTKLVIPKVPARIVSLAPGVTEMLYAVGAGKSVVGDTTYCDYPPEAKLVAHIGDFRTNYEAVLALHPDLVVASDANRAAADKLRQLKVKVLYVAPTSFARIEQSLTLIGQATGCDVGAAFAVQGMEHAAHAASALAKRDAKRPRVLCIIGVRPLWTAGQGTFVDDVLSRAGTVNVAGKLTGYGPLSPESVLARPPDWVVVSPSDAAALRVDPVLSRLPAVKAGRVVTVGAAILLRPGPRLSVALTQIAAEVHGSQKPPAIAPKPGRKLPIASASRAAAYPPPERWPGNELPVWGARTPIGPRGPKKASSIVSSVRRTNPVREALARQGALAEGPPDGFFNARRDGPRGSLNARRLQGGPA